MVDKSIEIRRAECDTKVGKAFWTTGGARKVRMVPAWDVIDTLTKCRYPGLNWEQAQAQKKKLLALEKEKVGFTRVKSDMNGNPRYVVDFSWFCTAQELDTRNTLTDFRQRLSNAHQRALSIGFSKYRGKDIMSGFVSSSYSPKTECMNMSRITGRRFVDFEV